MELTNQIKQILSRIPEFKTGRGGFQCLSKEVNGGLITSFTFLEIEMVVKECGWKQKFQYMVLILKL